jgi:hypothetical protein
MRIMIHTSESMMKNPANVIALATERKVDDTMVAVARFMKVLQGHGKG